MTFSMTNGDEEFHFLELVPALEEVLRRESDSAASLSQEFDRLDGHVAVLEQRVDRAAVNGIPDLAALLEAAANSMTIAIPVVATAHHVRSGKRQVPRGGWSVEEVERRIASTFPKTDRSSLTFVSVECRDQSWHAVVDSPDGRYRATMEGTGRIIRKVRETTDTRGLAAHG
jgi:hypothetical protein